ncbi:hypothetical protein [Paenibacillus sp. 481]|uniref:hypothetical protein n=1 Tax=Paenibacillus sp. 481 TaxID=2835869 RepID=UPI001E633EA2|nr:hypothetical protein [Paenibacillus sp. 481]UHA73910.1 hypothetical protein KIK04_01725 [Paenibacillus sp. 481]
MSDPWIYIVLLGAVVVMFGWFRAQKVTDGSTANTQRNMEETLEHYVEEVAAENEKLVTIIERMKKEGELRDDALRRRMDALEAKWEQASVIAHEEEQRATLAATIPSATQAVEPVSPQSMVASMKAATVKSSEYAIVGEPNTESDMASALSAVPTSEAEAIVETATPSIRERYADLFALMEEGVPEEQIAERLAMPRGEVQLVIQLAKAGGAV